MDNGLANSDLPKRTQSFKKVCLKKVCLTAFAESEFGNPFSFAESEFGNPGIFVTAYFLVTKINRERWVDEDVNFAAERRPPVPVFG